jgi:hypothetical protein
MNRFKAALWRHISRIFPATRDFLTKVGIVRHHGRQPFHLGWMTPGRSLEDFLTYIHTKGFHNHFIAWVDEGQILSLRRHDAKICQYHLRVFNDGEICGHYEITPEDHPVDHFLERGFQDRNKEFLEFLGDWIVQRVDGAEAGKIRFHKAPAASRT